MEKLNEREMFEALQKSEKRYRHLFESAKDGILIINADTGRVMDVNPFLLALIGYSYQDVCEKFIWELGTFKDIAASKEAFKTLQENHYIRYDDLPLLTLDGQLIDVEFVSNVYLVDGEKVIQCNIRDITQKKQMERALAESEAKIRSILDNIGLGIVLISPEMKVLELNRQMHEWFPGVDINREPTCYDVFNDPSLKTMCNNCPTAKTLHDGSVHEARIQISWEDKVHTCRIVSSPLTNASGRITGAIELIEDITDRLSLESQFLQAQKMESVGRLAGGVAHDYNNMLSVILGYAELALYKVGSSGPVHDDLLQIVKAAQRSTMITQQLLAFARKQTIAPRLIDLNAAIDGTLKMLTRLIGENIELAWLPGNRHSTVMMDPSQLDQVLANLCINARDAIPDAGKITIETGRVIFDQAFCNRHEEFSPGHFVWLAVCDDGCGMDNETRDHAFEPFFTTKGVGQGTGLGLSTVYGIVKQNQGVVYVYSEPGKGTTIKIYLPFRGYAAVDSPEDIPEHAIMGHGETILVVEDEAEVLKMIMCMLEAGLRRTGSRDGQRGH